jgi:hypothetical protein
MLLNASLVGCSSLDLVLKGVFATARSCTFSRTPKLHAFLPISTVTCMLMSFDGGSPRKVNRAFWYANPVYTGY